MNKPTILLVNPMGNVVKLIKSIINSNHSPLNYYIAVTAKTVIEQTVSLEECTEHVTVLDLKSSEWNFDVNFVNGIAFDYSGQALLESINSQILLKNPGTQDFRMDKFLPTAPAEGDLLIETISYQGRHIVIAAWKFLKGKHVKLHTEFDQEWNDAIELAFETLDNSKIINGPAQVYIDTNYKLIGIKLHPSNIDYTIQKSGTSRHWIDIWPTITALQPTNPISAQRKFYDWVESTGTAKTYTATPLSL